MEKSSAEKNGERPLEISATELKALLDGTQPPFLLDVREPDECEAGMLPGARNIPLGDLPDRLNELPKGRFIVVNCHSGMRSLRATNFLRDKGFADTSSLRGGVRTWSEEVNPNFPA